MNVDRLLGILQQFKESQEKANELNREEHLAMIKEIKEINAWRWRLEGVRLAVAAISGVVGSIAYLFLRQWMAS